MATVISGFLFTIGFMLAIFVFLAIAIMIHGE